MKQAAIMAIEANRQDEFRDLLERHRRIVFKVANTYSRQADDRADLAQEIAAQCWRAFPGYDPRRPFATWMYRIALNVAISHVRSEAHRQRHAVPLDEELHDIANDGDPDHEAGERVRALHRFISQLEPLNRALLLLYLEDHSTREIADILGISATNVSTKISRIKQRIRTDIAD